MIYNHNCMFARTLVALMALLIMGNCYNSGLALHLGYYSSIAYQSAASINAWNCARCSKYPLTNVKVFTNSGGDIQGFTGHSASLNAIVLSFRGSSNIQNWILNLQTNMVSYPRCTNCKVHNGFNNGFNLVKNTINSQIQALRALFRSAPIYITGHSLGGALGVMAAPEMKETFGNIAGMYTFGQPRVGNAEFAKYLDTVIGAFRVVHNGDIVPHIPPSAFTFVHASTEIWYDAPMQNYKTCHGDSNACSNSLPVTSLNTGDHSMDLYLNLKAVNTFSQVFEMVSKVLINIVKGERLRRQ